MTFGVPSWFDEDGLITEGTQYLVAANTVSITVDERPTGGSLPGAQNVRIDPLQNPERYVGEAATQSSQWILVVCESSVDLQQRDQFTHETVRYVVHSVSTQGGLKQAFCRALLP